MKKRVWVLCMAVVMLAGLFSGCGQTDQVTLKVYNWGDFIAEEVISDFEAETGIKVIYDTYDDNEKLYTKISNAGSNSYDVVFPSDYMVQKLIGENRLHKINYENVPNIQYVDNAYRNLSYDPESAYSIPYMWGTLGILYNKEMTAGDTINSMDCFFNGKYRGEIFMLNGMRDTMGMTLKHLGYSMNTQNLDELAKARDLLIAQKKDVLGYVTDEVKDKMLAGEGAIALVFSGEGVKAADESDGMLDFVIPKEGTNIAVDNMCILSSSTQIEAAEQFLNFMLRPDIALRNAEYTGYSTPHTEARGKLPVEMAKDARRYPDQALLDCSEVFEFIPDDFTGYTDAWTKILAE